MITGSQLRAARTRAGLTQEQLAERLGTSFRSIGNWERGDPPAAREALIRDALGDHLQGLGGNPLAEYSDVALLAEVGRRMAQGGQQDGRRPEAEKNEQERAAGRQQREDAGTDVRDADGPRLTVVEGVISVNRDDLPEDLLERLAAYAPGVTSGSVIPEQERAGEEDQDDQ